MHCVCFVSSFKQGNLQPLAAVLGTLKHVKTKGDNMGKCASMNLSSFVF